MEPLEVVIAVENNGNMRRITAELATFWALIDCAMSREIKAVWRVKIK